MPKRSRNWPFYSSSSLANKGKRWGCVKYELCCYDDVFTELCVALLFTFSSLIPRRLGGSLDQHNRKHCSSRSKAAQPSSFACAMRAR